MRSRPVADCGSPIAAGGCRTARPEAAARRRPRSGGRGFTLLELLVVIVIIGIMSALTMVGVMAALKSAKRSSTENLIQQIEGAMESYRLRWGDYPPTSLAEFNVKLPNDANTGIESLTACLSSQDRGGILFQTQDVEQYANIDEDKVGKNVCNWFFGDNQLREIVDMFGQPLMYIHHKDYAKPPPAVTQYLMRPGTDVVKIVPAKAAATRTYAWPDKYQLFSAGADGVPGNADDVVGW